MNLITYFAFHFENSLVEMRYLVIIIIFINSKDLELFKKNDLI